ncbi:NAD(P)/FAD-dependent oxidoreductase [Aspergillus ibericus CBS 121593]|uniref:FAD dependent oxidoreductase superfamily n=1 Tax=Aspergillus ibericus CBS 121593 TaxID=1448316 RepID=A0A395H6U3_9EURO|nr:FAD dependent oxidoreductase superfamily [Aspergillus ibericus CBS 121593]RAL03233.1 FAD dependent oxidoreductase superfamily [Aspergillus ibericus CBS 121593]
MSPPHPGFPIENPITSYWLKTPHPLASYRSSPTVPNHCDIAIIGTGLAGVATAYHILSGPHAEGVKPSVVLLEARQVCSGATGRNGGHTKLAITIAKELYDSYDEEAAAQVTYHQLEQLSALKEVVEKEGIECELKVTRSFDVFFDGNHARDIREFLYVKKSEGVAWAREVEWIEEADVERITGVVNGKGAVGVPAVSLWPYKLVTALLSRVLELGGQLYTETLVTNMEGSSPTTLLTSRGTLIAKKTIFATNAYTGALLPQYKGFITPVKGQNSHLAPLPSFRPPIPLKNTYNLRFSTEYADYLVPQPNGTIILGGAKWTYDTDQASWWNTVDDRTVINNGATAHFDSVMARHFHGWEDANANHDMVWSGIMGYTPDTLPHVGRVPGSQCQWILAGFNGAGMVMIFTMTRAIASMVVKGLEYEETGLPGLFKSTSERLAVRQ